MSRNGAQSWTKEASERFRLMVEAEATFDELCAAFPDRPPSGIKWRIKKVRLGYDPNRRPDHGQFVRIVERIDRRCLCCRRMFVSVNRRTNWLCHDCSSGHTEDSRMPEDHSLTGLTILRRVL